MKSYVLIFGIGLACNAFAMNNECPSVTVNQIAYKGQLGDLIKVHGIIAQKSGCLGSRGTSGTLSVELAYDIKRNQYSGKLCDNNYEQCGLVKFRELLSSEAAKYYKDLTGN